MVLLFWLTYYMTYSLPLQSSQNIELSENVGINDNITVKKYQVFKVRIYPTFCNSSAQGYNLRMSCKA